MQFALAYICATFKTTLSNERIQHRKLSYAKYYTTTATGVLPRFLQDGDGILIGRDQSYILYRIQYNIAIDASKAFDRINHRKVISKLIQRQFPTCFLNIFVNWYSKLYSCVRWNGVLSSCFKVLCGVRQGGIIVPHFI